MADETWQQIRKIFDDALRHKPAERRRFVEQACVGNQILLTEVESLLSSLDSAEEFLETPAVANVADLIDDEARKFEPGHCLGHYEIVRQIGRGGMGTVYLARDTKLQRRVALKVLRENVLSDERSNHKLLREARAAALLEHPNISAIYEISETPDCNFIVMQFVDGETLADILTKETLTLELSLDLAIQIADGLAEAHLRGIIHRDIKPANIMVNDKMQAKILDFGLAKFIAPDPSLETIGELKSSGAVMGTVPYMSPEQLRGKPVDARTDIFSLGALFYEMLTGRQAYGRENNAETISAILNDEPDRTGVPPELQPILRKCVMKNRGLRYESAQAVGDALRELQKRGGFYNQTEAISTSLNAQVVTNDPLGAPSRKPYFWQSSKEIDGVAPATGEIANERTAQTSAARRNYAPAVLGFALFTLLSSAVFLFWQLNKTDDLHAFDDLRSVNLVSWKTAASSVYSDYRVSHDGKMIAYSSNQDGPPEGIFVKQTTDGGEIRVTKDEWNNVTPIWSPNDQRIAFASIREGQAGIYSIPALGGVAVPLKITGKSNNVRLRHWSKDGAAIFYEFEGNLFRLDLATSGVKQVTSFVSNKALYFSISPDEQNIVYVDRSGSQPDLWMSPIAGGPPLRLTNDKDAEIQPRWHPDGTRILYTVHRNNYDQINVAYVDARPPRQVTRGESDFKMIDVSSDGSMIYYLSRESKSDIWGVRTGTGEEFEIASGIESEFWTDVSPNGQSIAYQKNPSNVVFRGNPAIVIQSLINQFPPFSVKGYNARWLPDNRRIAFLRRDAADQRSNLWIVNTINGDEKQITSTDTHSPGYSLLPYNRTETREYTWSPDNTRVAYLATEAGFWNIWATSPESNETVNLTNSSDPNLSYFCPQFSPDGTRIAYVSRQKPVSKDERTIWKIWIMEDEASREIYSTTASLRLLGWSSAGELILEQSEVPMAAIPLNITLLRISGTGVKKFETVFKSIYVTSMSLSADAKMVVFTARQDNKDNIWIASTASGEIKRITSNSDSKLFYGSPALSPDGKTIFFDKQGETNIISRLENFN